MRTDNLKLEIEDYKNTLSDDFIVWLISKISEKIISDVNINKLVTWDNFFNEQSLYKSIYKKKISSLDLIIAGSRNLIYTKSQSSFCISVNPNIYAPGLDRIKLITICKLINYGNQDITSYPIFTDSFKHFAENIYDYVDMYLYNFNNEGR